MYHNLALYPGLPMFFNVSREKSVKRWKTWEGLGMRLPQPSNFAYMYKLPFQMLVSLTLALSRVRRFSSTCSRQSWSSGKSIQFLWLRLEETVTFLVSSLSSTDTPNFIVTMGSLRSTRWTYVYMCSEVQQQKIAYLPKYILWPKLWLYDINLVWKRPHMTAGFQCWKER